MSQILNSNINGVVPPVFNRAYGQVYNQGVQNINPGGTIITFDTNGPLFNVLHVAGTGQVTLSLTGVYFVNWTVEVEGFGGLFQVLKNGVAVPQLSYITDPSSGDNAGFGIVSVTAGDVFQLNFIYAGAPGALLQSAGYTNASMAFATI